MKHIGDKAFTFLLPAVIDGRLIYFDPARLEGRWTALSFVPGLESERAAVLDHQGEVMARLDTIMLVVPPGSRPLHQLQTASLGAVYFVILGDPLGRLQRIYGGPFSEPLSYCRTFLIDPEGILRFHLVHSLSEQGMGVLMQLLHGCQDAEIAALP